ncbi:hypothetical protein [Pseudomonas sp. 25 R 14]|uniref:hypothetical protein n=1 Tax=Pseudomonas sp. 25 R 14 TaxID=1844109 RepID=UPI00081267C3|nr:hypothetical protein [Pseudomonas sp. 25 R 14]CRM72850.1 hypothetical protein [Pseudomonas sp. 25 R 14]
MGWYKEGKVNVVAGQTSVTGVGTNFAANSLVGDAFIGPDGQWYEVINAPSPTTLSISPAYRGATVSNANYALMPVQGYQRDLAIAAGAIIQQWGATLAGLGAVSTENVVPVAKGGTGGTTSSTARANLGLGTAAVAALVGAVSQSGGVPTGAVMQYGSNANGSFIRYADGTQICWQKASTAIAVTSGPANGLYYGSVIWTFPAQFYAAPVATGSTQSDGVITVDLGGPSTVTQFSPGVGALASIASRTFSLNLISIGRWYA